MTPYYSDELVTLYLGNCRDILPGLEPVDLVLTDPPYGINYISNKSTGRGSRPITNDGARLSVALQRSVIPLLRAKHVLWFTRWDVWPDVWMELGPHFPLRGMLIWDKNDLGMGDLNHWGPSYEMIASAGWGRTTGKREQSILRFPKLPTARRMHPAEKPPGLLQYLIDKLQPDTTLDPFAGAGSTLVAAKVLGRRAIGIEIEEGYCEVAAKRLSQAVMMPEPTPPAAAPEALSLLDLTSDEPAA